MVSGSGSAATVGTMIDFESCDDALLDMLSAYLV